MTDRQQAILDYLQERHANALPPPSIREIGEKCGISSTSVVAYNLEVLVRRGLIQWHRETARGIVVCDTTATVDLAAEVKRLRRRLAVSEAAVKALRQELATVKMGGRAKSE